MTDELYIITANNKGVQERSALRSMTFKNLTSENQLTRGHSIRN